jgi:hypothetical protein
LLIEKAAKWRFCFKGWDSIIKPVKISIFHIFPPQKAGRAWLARPALTSFAPLKIEKTYVILALPALTG